MLPFAENTRYILAGIERALQAERGRKRRREDGRRRRRGRASAPRRVCISTRTYVFYSRTRMLVCVHATWTKERATSEHACTWKRACTHTSTLPAAKTGVRKSTNPEQRRESVGQPRGAVAANGRQGAREFRVGFPLSAHELLVARARQTGRGGKKKKKEWESARTSEERRREGYTVGKKERGRRSKEKKREEWRVCIALPPQDTRKSEREKRERGSEKGGRAARKRERRKMPNERAPQTSRRSLAKETRAW